PAAAVFSHDEELSHVTVDVCAAVRARVQQGKADKVAVEPNQQRNMLLFFPVGIKKLIVAKPAVVLKLAIGAVPPLLREVVDVELEHVFERHALAGLCLSDLD